MKVFLTVLHMDVPKFGMQYVIVSNSIHLWKNIFTVSIATSNLKKTATFLLFCRFLVILAAKLYRLLSERKGGDNLSPPC